MNMQEGKITVPGGARMQRPEGPIAVRAPLDTFDDLLENTKGVTADQRRDIEDMVETLVILGALSQDDLQASTRYVLDHLPEIRMQRAWAVTPFQQAAPPQIEGMVSPVVDGAKKDRLPPLHSPQALGPDYGRVLDRDGVRVFDQKEAQRIAASAEKLARPGADEQFKRRAALVELSIRLKARLREVAQSTPDLDPDRLKKFKSAMRETVRTTPTEMGSRADRELMARMAFVQELRATRGNVDLAVDNFYKGAFGERERGHFGDVGVDRETEDGLVSPILADQQTQDPLQDWVDREEAREDAKAQMMYGVLQDLPKLAAERLKPGQYAAYRVMIDNEHLMDWKIQKDGKLHFQAKTLDASDDSNTIGKILKRELDYRDIRGANDLIQATLAKLNQVIRVYDAATQEVVLSKDAEQRMGKATSEILADPAAKAKEYKGRGKGMGI